LNEKYCILCAIRAQLKSSSIADVVIPVKKNLREESGQKFAGVILLMHACALAHEGRKFMAII